MGITITMSDQENHLYSAQCAGIETSGKTEMGYNIIYVAEHPETAIVDAARFLKNRCEIFHQKPGCIKVSEFYPEKIGPDGSYHTGLAIPFFEWKCDTSHRSLDEIILMEGRR